MEIAPKVQAADWRALKLDVSASPDWATAVRILESRIHERYIEPVDQLIAADESRPAFERRFGFIVLAIDCLLIETLGAFLEGLEDTKHKSEATFCRFLTTRPPFSSDFTKELAERFYNEFRCGILHQAEIAGDGKVWSVGPLIHEDGRRLIVNRTLLHERLKAEFQSYLCDLRSPIDEDLRAKFRRKMDFISRV